MREVGGSVFPFGFVSRGVSSKENKSIDSRFAHCLTHPATACHVPATSAEPELILHDVLVPAPIVTDRGRAYSSKSAVH